MSATAGSLPLGTWRVVGPGGPFGPESPSCALDPPRVKVLESNERVVPEVFVWTMGLTSRSGDGSIARFEMHCHVA